MNIVRQWRTQDFVMGSAWPKGRATECRKRGWDFWEGQPASSHHLAGLGSAVSSPAGSGAETRPASGFAYI